MSSAPRRACAAVPASNARAEASRRNGAKSRGPKVPEGKARSARNPLKHGLRAEKYVVLLDEYWDEFVKLEAGLVEELAPDGALQSILARRVACAAWAADARRPARGRRDRGAAQPRPAWRRPRADP